MNPYLNFNGNCREAVEFYGTAFGHHPVGTGPYVLANGQQNYRYEYRANPKWAE